VKPIEVKDPVRLGPARAFSLSLTSMYYRMTRSAITVLILTLAVAFMSYVLFYGIISNDAKYYASNRLKESRMLGEWISRLTAPDPHQIIFDNIISGNSSAVAEYAAWGRLSDGEMDSLKNICGRLRVFYSYFDAIPRSSRAVLLADSDPMTLAEQLRDPRRFEEFIILTGQLKLQTPMGGRQALWNLVAGDLPRVNELMERIRQGHRSAYSRVQKILDTVSLQEAFVKSDGTFRQVLRDAGFVIPDADAAHLARQAADDISIKRLGMVLEQPEARTAVARIMGITQSDLNLLRCVEWMHTKGRANRIASAIAHYGGREAGLDGKRLRTLAEEHQRTVILQKTVGDEKPYRRAGLFSLPPRTLWLILVSFLVCVVGISNTMLMSVTDRFNEIATMKCLGAMDEFIMVLFVFEAMMQGVVGSAAGVVLGVILSMLRAVAGYGGLVFESLPAVDVLLIALISFVMGIAIAGLAATWPSWTAARLAPMEAMRVE